MEWPIWDKKNECLDRTKLENLQFSRLKDTLECVYNNVPHYKQCFDGRGLNPSKVKSLEDLRNFPFTTKVELRDNYPFGLFTKPMEEVVRIHSSSGTTGKPTVVGYSVADLETWRDLIARVVTMGGVTRKDVAQIAFGYGLFTGGFGLHYGLEKVGATVIPISSGNTKRQLMIMKDFGSTTLICTPTYALYISEVMQEEGISKDELSLKWGLFGGEPMSNETRAVIENSLGIKATDNYGLSEIIGPGVAGECLAQDNMHFFEDHFYPEIIDPETEKVLPVGEKGELVITTLTKDIFPVIRYRTRDITRIIEEPCSCGRSLRRIEKISGRTDDMLIIGGVNVFPSQIESVLLEIEGTTPYFQIVIDESRILNRLEIWVEVTEGIFMDEMRQLRALEEKIKKDIFAVLGISAKIKLVEPKKLERSQGKAKRIVERSQLSELSTREVKPV